MDIQYNRNEDFKTIILPNNKNTSCNSNSTSSSTSSKNSSSSIEPTATAAQRTDGPKQKILDDESSAKQTLTEATLLLNDHKEIETTVIFLPNVWSLMPNSVEYQKIVESYKNFIENPPAEQQPISAKTSQTTTATTTNSSVKNEPLDSDKQQPQQDIIKQATSEAIKSSPIKLQQQKPKEEKPDSNDDEMANSASPTLSSQDNNQESEQPEMSSIETITKSLKAL